MSVDLYSYQVEAIENIKSGSIVHGGVGSGKSRTSLAYYVTKECKGRLKINGKGDFSKMRDPKDLYIITTAKKRDTLEWERECTPFLISKKPELNVNPIKLVIDSWNNIKKYRHIKHAFFIFDEQRLVGSGAWVKSFLKISKSNNWILLTATPGDTWVDYIPVFVANGFYKNRTEFLERHAVYNRFTKYPQIEKFIETKRLERLRNEITVTMHYERPTVANDKIIITEYNKEIFKRVMVDRWNIFNNKPIKTAAEACYLMRKVVNMDLTRTEAIEKIVKERPKVIVFYNFDYELDILRRMSEVLKIPTAEWNGHNHQEIPKTTKWIYLVQYSAGCEGWNCIETDTIIFYSQNYSYKTMVQAAGRIDRVNTKFKDLYYFHLRSNAPIDVAIYKALKKKKTFNTRDMTAFAGFLGSSK